MMRTSFSTPVGETAFFDGKIGIKIPAVRCGRTAGERLACTSRECMCALTREWAHATKAHAKG